MSSPDRSRKLLRRMALLCTVLVLVITSLSAYIRLSRAGLSCADWPQCYGEGLRQAQQGIAATAGESDATAIARLTHRVVASTALLVIVTMVVVCFTARPVRWADGRVALALLVLALGLAVLGRWSSDARVPAVAIGNLLGGFAMLALSWRLTHDAGAGLAPGWRAWARIAALLVVLQVALGGLVSASFAATSCTGFSDCIGAARSLPWDALDPWREPVLAGAPPINASGALAQAMHRVLGVLLLLAIAPLALAALRSARRMAAAVLLATLALVIGLGLVMAGSGPTLGIALAHNLGAALLLATLVELSRSPQPTAQPTANPALHSATRP